MAALKHANCVRRGFIYNNYVGLTDRRIGRRYIRKGRGDYATTNSAMSLDRPIIVARPPSSSCQLTVVDSPVKMALSK